MVAVHAAVKGKGAGVKESRMVDKVCDALARRGIQDRIVAAAMFFPRGHFGGAFGGGLIGGDLGERVSGLSGALGTVGGAEAPAANGASGLPERMLVGVSDSSVYGFGTRPERERDPTDLVFQLPRSQLDVRVQRRVGVRVVELHDRATGARVELEGARMPGFHVRDVLHALGV
jgi:hypothetical protein